MIENHNSQESSFSNKDVKQALSWTEKLVLETGTRLTGTAGCKKASKIIYKKLKEICPVVNQQDFIHHREAFLSFFKLMTISYIIALLGLWFGGIGNYIAAFGMVFVSIATFFEFVFYREFLDFLFKKTEGRNIIGRVDPAGEVNQTLIFSAHYDSPYVFHYLQNIQKNYILIVIITLTVYFLGLIISLSAMLFQILSPGSFTYEASWLIGMSVGLIFILPYYFFITDEVSPGAGDNLIAVSILLQLAGYFKKPENALQNTELVFLITDAEESGLRGARAFVKEHHDQLTATPHYNYNMDSIFSVNHLTFLTSDINNTVNLSNNLAEKGIQIAKTLGYTAEKMKIPFGGGATDSGEFAKVGIPSTSLIAMDTTFKSGSNPYHTRDDNTENIDPEAVLACLQIAHGFACHIDSLHSNKL